MSNQQVTRSRPTMWDKEQMFHFIEKMCEIPKQFNGLRRAGYEADAAVRNFLENELKSLGINDVTQKEISFTKEMYTKWELLINNQKFPCYFLRGAKFTDEQGIEAELLYVGNTIKGTNHVERAAKGKNPQFKSVILGPGWYLTTSDTVVDTSFYTTYTPYKNLTLHCLLSYTTFDLSKKAWRNVYYDDAFRGIFGFTYNF